MDRGSVETDKLDFWRVEWHIARPPLCLLGRSDAHGQLVAEDGYFQRTPLHTKDYRAEEPQAASPVDYHQPRNQTNAAAAYILTVSTLPNSPCKSNERASRQWWSKREERDSARGVV